MPEESWSAVERLAPPTCYTPDVSRYAPMDYPIPHDPVTKETYMELIEKSGCLAHAHNPCLGLAGPTKGMPLLAKYVQTGDRRWGDAIVVMLKDFHRALRDEVGTKGWTENFIEEPAFIPLYRKHLIEGGLMAPDAVWFRDMWLFYARNLHVWNSEPVEWRGGCHRSLPEALVKGLAALWYPDISEAQHWKRYSELTFEDFWRFKDVPQNDTGYFITTLMAFVCSGDQLLGDHRFVTDPGMVELWDRIGTEVTPDGSINPYGPNGGWNSTATFRIWVFELAAAKTGDGRYRYLAQRMMNYLKYQVKAMAWTGFSFEVERVVVQQLALAYLVTDDTVQPLQPASGSVVTHRKEMALVTYDNKEVVGRYYHDLDDNANRNHLCCGWAMTQNVMLDKLVLRSGWDSGGLFAVVELFPRSFPFNVGGIMGLTRWAAPFTQICTSKGAMEENRLSVVPTSEVERRYIGDAHRHGENWERGRMRDISSSLPVFHDFGASTIARVEVASFDGLPVRYVREFVFVKDRFLVTRELVTFEEAFSVRLAPLWNTRNVGAQIGPNWANTFLGNPIAFNSTSSMVAPPADLLVYFAPKEGCRMQVVDRTVSDLRTRDCPVQLRYLWEGDVKPGQTHGFSQVYYPHAPSRPRPDGNNVGAKVLYDGGELAATAGASAITVLRDDTDVTVLRLEFEPGRVEYVVLNPKGTVVGGDQAAVRTDAQYAYIDTRDGEVTCLDVVEGTFVNLWHGGALRSALIKGGQSQ